MNEKQQQDLTEMVKSLQTDFGATQLAELNNQVKQLEHHNNMENVISRWLTTVPYLAPIAPGLIALITFIPTIISAAYSGETSNPMYWLYVAIYSIVGVVIVAIFESVNIAGANMLKKGRKMRNSENDRPWMRKVGWTFLGFYLIFGVGVSFAEYSKLSSDGADLAWLVGGFSLVVYILVITVQLSRIFSEEINELYADYFAQMVNASIELSAELETQNEINAMQREADLESARLAVQLKKQSDARKQREQEIKDHATKVGMTVKAYKQQLLEQEQAEAEAEAKADMETVLEAAEVSVSDSKKARMEYLKNFFQGGKGISQVTLHAEMIKDGVIPATASKQVVHNILTQMVELEMLEKFDVPGKRYKGYRSL